MNFEREEKDADSYLDREKRKADRKDLKAVDHNTEEYD